MNFKLRLNGTFRDVYQVSREANYLQSRSPFLENHFSSALGGTILFVSSNGRRLEARSFAVILIFIPFTAYEKIYRINGSEIYEWLSGPKQFSGLSRNGPLAIAAISRTSFANA